MHVTSDYFRSHDGQSSDEMGIAGRRTLSVQCAARAKSEQQQAPDENASHDKPLKPSSRTLKMMARHYKNQHGLRRSA
jgi:hypothetical protein